MTTPEPQHTDVPRTAAPVEPSAEPGQHSAVASEPDARPAADATHHDGESLFHGIDLSGLRSRWDEVQAAFVDDPRDCVQKADGLVSEVVDQLTTGFAQARERLEEQWSRGQEASTEDLRQALKSYREFFQRLLSVS